MKVWQVKIATTGTFLLKKCPTGNALCNILGKNTKMADPFLSAIRKALEQKGWGERKLPSLVSLPLDCDCTHICIYCTPVDVLD